jgi:glycerol-3-phosphate acyltransferase PlsX
MKIAVDAMGGDYAPSAIVRGAEAAVREGYAQVVLVGDEERIRPLLTTTSGIEIVHAPTAVEMDESPSVVLRKKKDSSINIAFTLHKSHHVQAVVSAGNSGAVMGFAIFTLGRLQGVDRPGIMTLNPTVKGAATSLLLDAGGTVDCKPNNLVQFALMGNVFARCVLGIAEPRIGVLSNGHEETKGNELTRETHAILKKQTGINYAGYIEGTDMYNGNTDVVITDGFVGNVALKISEGVAEAITGYLKERIQRSMRNRLGYLLLSDLIKELARMVDYSEYGGAPLLGIDGVCIICHGKSNERAIKNAVRMASEFVNKNLTGHIKDAMEEYSSQNRTKER